MVLLKVRKIGNSLGVILPAGVIRGLRVQEGDNLFLTEAPDGSFRIAPYDPDFADAKHAAKSVMARYKITLRKLAK